MLNTQLSQSDQKIFRLKALLWLVFGWTGFLLALSGIFYAWIVWAVFLVGAGLLAFDFFKKRGPEKMSRELLFVSTGIIFFTIFLAFFTVPTVFSGRDQGSLSEAAVRLAENHTLTFSNPASNAFFKIRGAGRTLNFPGFFYTNNGNLITQFPLVYISWLASFYGVFGIVGFTIANTVSTLLFLFTFYFLARMFMPIWGSVVSLLFAATSLSVFWFPKYTLSENLALPLVWLSVFALLGFLKKQTKFNLFFLSIALFLLAFTRIEGVAILLVSLGILFFKKETQIYLKSIFGFKLLLALFFLLLVLIANTFWDFNFFKELAKAILPTVTPPQATQLGIIANPETPKFYLLKVFQLYGMLGFFVLATVAVIFYAWRKQTMKLIPLLVIAPTLIYFLDSHISPDHPWMLRRFSFSLLPAAIFYCALFLSDLNKHFSGTKKNILLKSIPPIIALALLAGNLPAFLNFATFSENKNLLEQVKTTSQLFSKNDLVLVDSQAAGDGWSMIAGPMNFLYGKNAAYFFNTQDLIKLDLQAFENIYLISPDSRIPFYTNSTLGNSLAPNEQYTFSTQQLEIGPNTGEILSNFPAKKSLKLHGIIFKISK